MFVSLFTSALIGCGSKPEPKAQVKAAVPKPERQPVLVDDNEEQFRPVTTAEIETFGKDLFGKTVEMAGKFNWVSSTWTREWFPDDSKVGFSIKEGSKAIFYCAFPDKWILEKELVRVRGVQRGISTALSPLIGCPVVVMLSRSAM